MALIQNSVKKREGRKWKQRWVVLRKDSLKSCQEVYYYLFFYKDAAHAKEGKEKYVLPLVDFCGLDFCRLYDKEENILVLVTSSQTVYLSFDQLSLRDHWKQTLIGHFGEGNSYKIIIPDKQKLKPGNATIRVYSTFVSIITDTNYKCLSRWYTNDIHSYSAVDRNHFMFEITSLSKTKGGNVINLEVHSNAEDISQAFDSVAAETKSDESTTLVRHGSAMLDELCQAKRNVGDQNFFRRAILRASERMRKKKRVRTQSAPFQKAPVNPSMSIQEQEKFRSLDRKKNPQISIDLDKDSLLQTMQIVQTSETSPKVTKEESPPLLPRKKSSQNHGSLTNDTSINKCAIIDSDNHESVVNRDNIQQLVEATSTISTKVENNVKDGNIAVLEEGKISDKIDGKPEILKSIDLSAVVTDKSDISNKKGTRHSVDSCLNNYKNPAKYLIAKTKGGTSKTKIEKTPTPPPRSPVSLGIEPSVFQFPPEESENFTDSVFKEANESNNPSPSSSLSDSIKENNVNSPSESKKAISDITMRTDHDSDSTGTNDAYENLPKFQNNTGSNFNFIIPHLKTHPKKCSSTYQSDPLDFEAWTKATGDGKIPPISPDTNQKFSDYVNMKRPQSDEDCDSYVNVTDVKPQQNKPRPPKLNPVIKRYQNEFEKYDDDDQSVYHPVGPVDENSLINNSSYENVNGVRSSPSNYLNVNRANHSSPDPSKLNYIDLGLPDTIHVKSNSPVQTPNSSSTNYTRINVNATGAMILSIDQHRQHRDSGATRTPTRTSR